MDAPRQGGLVSERRWIDPRQPQTLQIATFILYFYAVIALIGALFGQAVYALPALAGAAGAFGMANEKRWGYQLAVLAASVRLLLPIVLYGLTDILRSNPIGFMMSAAIVALLLHPQSRDYQRIWYS
jgi:hypothetical protein